VSLAKAVPVLALFAATLLVFASRASAQTNQSASQPFGKPAAQGAASSAAPSAVKPSATTGQPSPRYVNCHALEAHANAQSAVTIVVFTQRDKPDHARLSDLIKENDGGGVELRTSDGKWHKATLVRLRTCFGRGMLFLAGDAGEPKDRENFLLRFPPKKIS
jgi:hypothetical protein